MNPLDQLRQAVMQSVAAELLSLVIIPLAVVIFYLLMGWFFLWR